MTHYNTCDELPFIPLLEPSERCTDCERERQVNILQKLLRNSAPETIHCQQILCKDILPDVAEALLKDGWIVLPDHEKIWIKLIPVYLIQHTPRQQNVQNNFIQPFFC